MLRILLSSTNFPQEPRGSTFRVEEVLHSPNISNSSLHRTSQNRVFSLATVRRTLFLTRTVISEQPLQNTAAVLLLIMKKKHNGVVLDHNNELLWFISYHTIWYGRRGIQYHNFPSHLFKGWEIWSSSQTRTSKQHKLPGHTTCQTYSIHEIIISAQHTF
jgi:hypothetical protein